MEKIEDGISKVLNLVINGIPSILIARSTASPLYEVVLNLVINGIPSILKQAVENLSISAVLNLVINGIPSIPT